MNPTEGPSSNRFPDFPRDPRATDSLIFPRSAQAHTMMAVLSLSPWSFSSRWTSSPRLAPYWMLLEEHDL